jgi:Lar family restriction alleviation protein
MPSPNEEVLVFSVKVRRNSIMADTPLPKARLITTDDHLLPCPWCGGDMVRVGQISQVGDFYMVNCLHCRAENTKNDTVEKAIARWNTRSDLE